MPSASCTQRHRLTPTWRNAGTSTEQMVLRSIVVSSKVGRCLAERRGSRGSLRRVPGYERGVVRRVRAGCVVAKGPARLLDESRRRQLGVHPEFLKDGFDLRSHGGDRHGRPSGDRLGGAPLRELGKDELLAPSQDLERGQAGLGLLVVGLDQPLPKVFPKPRLPAAASPNSTARPRSMPMSPSLAVERREPPSPDCWPVPELEP